MRSDYPVSSLYKLTLRKAHCLQMLGNLEGLALCKFHPFDKFGIIDLSCLCELANKKNMKNSSDFEDSHKCD